MQLYLKVGMIIVLMLLTVNAQQYSSDDSLPAEELSAVVRALLQPENYKYEMHRKSLENALENILAAAAYESEYYEPLEEDEKRSIATLAKNGQLPSKEPDTEMETLSDDDNGHKRNIASMARSGHIGGKRNIQSLARQWPYGNGGKRNIGSIMRDNMFPGSGKRNIASMARNGFGKRNVGTLARDWALPKFNGKQLMDDGKRNIQSMKNSIKSGRKKRDVGENEALEPFYQNGPVDYEELLQSLNDEFPYFQNPAEKRFLATSDSDPSTISSSSGYQKRHIGSMVEYFYPQDHLRPIAATSCRRCDFDHWSGGKSRWGFSDNNLGVRSLTSPLRTRSGFRSTPPRVTALSWRDRF
ncbi:CLUMA_CG017822, isoform A [Clunio marinus]|uniref:CLUMA_CG017822, isoform A n=1 Tax=Clunio marinus TaxID=568069 RepID=A0A1J1IYI9_9DIPT|nr:CLUMA_CG017822, isoform A [Clunio marinus]